MSKLAPTLHITDANLSYQNTCLFEQLSIDFPAQSFNCLLGPSGVGKTSLLRLIAGLHVDAGSVQSIQAHDQRPLSGRIAYLAQDDGLLPWLSVMENVLIGPRLRNAKQIETMRQWAYKLFDQVGLSQAVSNKKPQQLSGGMRQRVALVRTLIENRPIVLMDEPFARLDAITRMALQTLAVNLLQDRTVIMVTHDPLEALRMAENIFVMNGQPAQIEKVLVLPDTAPREITRDEMVQHYQLLLTKISTEKPA